MPTTDQRTMPFEAQAHDLLVSVLSALPENTIMGDVAIEAVDDDFAVRLVPSTKSQDNTAIAAHIRVGHQMWRLSLEPIERLRR